ncbi:MAG: fumarylacetoacetate hydrolase family protein [Bryobacterales bacterium]|nr:fumarylacetoacetate hydrolase family protein [Bryobacterales bacterium]
MKLAQVRDGGRAAVAIQEAGGYRMLRCASMNELLAAADASGRPLAEIADEAAGDVRAASAELLLPLEPAEIWACGCTYAPSADFRDGELGTRDGMYSYVHKPENRPEIFFKGTARVCVGPGEPIGIRGDSSFTAPEPELGIVIGSSGAILAYTLGNDVSAWDIERENALYLPQSKVYDACCALGPVLVTPDEVPDPYSLPMRCQITRAGRLTFSGSVSTSKLRRRLEELVGYLRRSNSLPTPTVVLTGTGIIVEQAAALRHGDVCAIDVPAIGTLSNPAALV